MKYCSKCGNQINDEAVVCVYCGCKTEQYTYDDSNIGLAFLGFFIPIVGLILYIVMHDRTPLKAKSAGKGALIGFIIKLVLCIAYVVLVVMAVSPELLSYYEGMI